MARFFKILLPIVILLAVLRFFFPPLMELGYADAGENVSLQMMINPNGGVDPLRIYLENKDGIDTARIANETCTSFVADMGADALPLTGLRDAGTMEVLFVGGGRYFFRLAKGDVFAFAYAADGCTLLEAESNG